MKLKLKLKNARSANIANIAIFSNFGQTRFARCVCAHLSMGNSAMKISYSSFWVRYLLTLLWKFRWDWQIQWNLKTQNPAWKSTQSKELPLLSEGCLIGSYRVEGYISLFAENTQKITLSPAVWQQQEGDSASHQLGILVKTSHTSFNIIYQLIFWK